ncbi:hypothetical protein BCR34DRAFT_650540 [Clohesyomyces aquaticus]|uniref:Uncharacterized protein n=1 Tax=Clohesyomyces aquaticus TaxID=1231657 RepID=A0A1Y1ZQZ9_9PLEO|nr:hypothetical protein BCR34DRAFT_650540 [Clohesyomyces aquaticus]
MTGLCLQYASLHPDDSFGTGLPLDFLSYVILQCVAFVCPPIIFAFCSLPGRSCRRDLRYNLFYCLWAIQPGVVHASLYLHDVYRAGLGLEPKHFHPKPKMELPTHSTRPENESTERSPGSETSTSSRRSRRAEKRRASRSARSSTSQPDTLPETKPSLGLDTSRALVEARLKCPICREENSHPVTSHELSAIPESESDTTPKERSLTKGNISKIPSSSEHKEKYLKDMRDIVSSSGRTVIQTQVETAAEDSGPTAKSTAPNITVEGASDSSEETVATVAVSTFSRATKATGPSNSKGPKTLYSGIPKQRPSTELSRSDAQNMPPGDELCQEHAHHKGDVHSPPSRSLMSFKSGMSVATALSRLSGHSVQSLLTMNPGKKPVYLKHKETCKLCGSCNICFDQNIAHDEALAAVLVRARGRARGSIRGSASDAGSEGGHEVPEPHSDKRHHDDSHHVHGCFCQACTGKEHAQDPRTVQHPTGCVCQRCRPTLAPRPVAEPAGKTMASLGHKQPIFLRPFHRYLRHDPISERGFASPRSHVTAREGCLGRVQKNAAPSPQSVFTAQPSSQPA